MKRFSEWLADRLADALATMVCFWVVTILILITLYWQRPHSLYEWVLFASSALFQASALPVLAFVAKKEGRRQEAILKETHDAVMEELKDLKELCKIEGVET